MTELRMSRSGDDKKKFELPGVGTIQKPKNWLSEKATLSTEAGDTFVAEIKHLVHPGASCTDAAGAEVGHFKKSKLQGTTGAVTWRGATYELRDESMGRRCTLVSGEALVAAFAAEPWGGAPFPITDVAADLDPGLLLFAVWLVRDHAEQQQGAAGA